MSLTDPTSGAGYSFGEKLPSAHMTTIATQQPNAWDIIGGGTHAANATSTITDAGSGAITFSLPVTVSSSGTMTWDGALNFPKCTSQTVQRYQDMSPLYNGNSRFAWDATGHAWDQDNVTGPGSLIIPLLNRPPTGTLTGVTLYVDGDGAGNTHSGLPVGLPSIQVQYSKPSSLFSKITTASQGDTSLNLSQYEIEHTIALTGISVDLADAADLCVNILGEQSTDSVAGALRLLGMFCYFTVTEIAP